jgi:hypothetical protein
VADHIAESDFLHIFTIQTTPIMTRYLPLLLLSLFCGLLLWSGCKKDDDDDNTCWDESNPECANFDPCWDKRTPVSAEFEVELFANILLPSSYPTIIAGDTVGVGGLKFRALDESAQTFEWWVGTDDRSWTDSEFSLSFPCSVENTSIPVTLITTRLRDTSCVSENMLRDTFTRNIYFQERKDFNILGTYVGVNDTYPGEPYEVTIETHCDPDVESLCNCEGYVSKLIGVFNLLNEDCIKIGSVSDLVSPAEIYIKSASTPNANIFPWLDPEETECDRSAWEPDYIYEWVRDVHAKLTSGSDSIEIHLIHRLETPSGSSLPWATRYIVFKGKKIW